MENSFNVWCQKHKRVPNDIYAETILLFADLKFWHVIQTIMAVEVLFLKRVQIVLLCLRYGVIVTQSVDDGMNNNLELTGFESTV